MSTSQDAGRRAIVFLLQRMGAGILIIGSVLTLLGLYWFPFKSGDIIRTQDGAVLGPAQSWTEWQFALNLDRIILIPFAFVALVATFALVTGGEEALWGGERFKRLRLRFTRRFLFLLGLAFLAQWFNILITSSPSGNICLPVPDTCSGAYYIDLRGDYGLWVSLIGLALLLAYQLIRYVVALPELEMQKHI